MLGFIHKLFKPTTLELCSKEAAQQLLSSFVPKGPTIFRLLLAGAAGCLSYSRLNSISETLTSLLQVPLLSFLSVLNGRHISCQCSVQSSQMTWCLRACYLHEWSSMKIASFSVEMTSYASLAIIYIHKMLSSLSCCSFFEAHVAASPSPYPADTPEMCLIIYVCRQHMSRVHNGWVRL